MDTGITRCRLTDFARRRWCAYPLYGLMVFSAWRVLDRIGVMPPPRATWLEHALVFVGYALIPAVYALILYWPLRGEGLRRVWTHLRQKYPTECPWCRYDVRGCPTPVCPECGKPVDPEAPRGALP